MKTMTKDNGHAIDLTAILITLVAVFLMMTSAVKYVKQVETLSDINSQLHYYLFMTSNNGGLSENEIKSLKNTMQLLGLSNVDTTGTTMRSSSVEQGDYVDIKITGTLAGENLTIVKTIIARTDGTDDNT